LDNDVAVLGNNGALSPWQVAPAQTAKYAGIARHHRKAFDDYGIAKAHILQAIGDFEDMQLFGSRVLLAVFCKPQVQVMKKSDGTEFMWISPLQEAKEDWWQGKSALILALGPDAFRGDESYIEATFGPHGAPKVFDWVFANANAGTQINLMGDGASRPQGLDMRGETIDCYGWDGWPCRVVDHHDIYGRLLNPQLAV